ncbi:hypothetical protein [Streptomyces sp. NPDC008139]|uniref:hypothetical protein n=1 Tax=Streptomyces sp. NPDC008139 TaxID=3364814 RepID=UPI0036DFEBB9
MPVLPEPLHSAAALTTTVGLLYASVLSIVALASVLARTPERRRDARSTLRILVRGRGDG